MRLINCFTLQVEEFFDTNCPPYAILSHTWGEEEVSFADFTQAQAAAASKKGYRKIAFTCHQALEDGLQYAWVDTCGIDKSSSAELSESINSMFRWYERADRCYVYLEDVVEANVAIDFAKSRWFTRGWTLQELLAPRDMVFYDKDWRALGTKYDHANWISEITAIDSEILDWRHLDLRSGLDSICVAKRMSWASRRKTTRTEDIAYCLLGIFNIHMPLLYGEGDRAFTRLQEEIMKTSNDESILAWGFNPDAHFDSFRKVTGNYGDFEPILAVSPKDFENCGNLEKAFAQDPAFVMTNVGLQMQLPLVPMTTIAYGEQWLGLLGCSPGTGFELLGIFLVSRLDEPDLNPRMARGRWGFCRTLRVDPRIAALSVTKSLTIRQREQPCAQGGSLRYHQVVVNEREVLRVIGYRVQTGTTQESERMGSHRAGRAIWDPEKRILSVRNPHKRGNLLSFGFTAPQKSAFTVFMRCNSNDVKLIVRPGTRFPENKIFAIELELEKQSPQVQDPAGATTIVDEYGRWYAVVPTVVRRAVHHWEIFSLNVDAVPLGHGERS